MNNRIIYTKGKILSENAAYLNDEVDQHRLVVPEKLEAKRKY